MLIADKLWQFTIQGVKISCNFKGAMKGQTHGTKARANWDWKKRFNEADDVEWQATEDTVKSMHQHRHHWLNNTHRVSAEHDG